MTDRTEQDPAGEKRPRQTGSRQDQEGSVQGGLTLGTALPLYALDSDSITHRSPAAKRGQTLGDSDPLSTTYRLREADPGTSPHDGGKP
jgi:hypothetical protein